MDPIEGFREWQPDEWSDELFLRSVPARAWKEFLKAVRPLNQSWREQVWHALFAGIKHPFDPFKATGWMHRLHREECELPDSTSHEQSATFLAMKLPWPEQDVVLLITNEHYSHATSWSSFLKYFRRGYLNIDTMLVCHPQSREIILFWEDLDLPILGKRGHRALPFPCYDPSAKGAEG